MISFLAAAALIAVLAMAGRGRFLEELPRGWRRALGAALLSATLAACVFEPLLASPPPLDAQDVRSVWFPSLFATHAAIGGFLVAWWVLARCPRPARYLRASWPGIADVRFGLRLGGAAWLAAITTAILASPVLRSAGSPPVPSPPPILLYLAALPTPHKLLLIGVAMLVEEAFFRGFLQPRLGWLLSSVLFALAHAGYGLPTLAVAAFAVSLTLAWGMERTGRLWPCVVAHGVFDAVQLLVVIPLALRSAGYGW